MENKQAIQDAIKFINSTRNNFLPDNQELLHVSQILEAILSGTLRVSTNVLVAEKLGMDVAYFRG